MVHELRPQVLTKAGGALDQLWSRLTSNQDLTLEECVAVLSSEITTMVTNRESLPSLHREAAVTMYESFVIAWRSLVRAHGLSSLEGASLLAKRLNQLLGATDAFGRESSDVP